MKIISNFHDMYDVMCGYGVDNKLVFKRINAHNINVNSPQIIFPESILNVKVEMVREDDIRAFIHNFADRKIELHHVMAVFNGNIAHTYILEKNGVLTKNVTCDDVREYLPSWNYHRHDVKNYNQYYLDIHKTIGCPIFFVYKGRVFKDLPLHYFGFQHLRDQCDYIFQEIAYCLGNVVFNNNTPPVAIDNNTKITQAGFDLKTSFRK